MRSHDRIAWPVLVLVIVIAASGCERGAPAPKAKSAPPAKVEHHPKEADLNVIHLTAQAESRLGIAIAKVEREAVRVRRTFGGEVIVPPG